VSATPRYDVVIAGGGLVGAALACALGELPLSVLVVEAVPPRASAQPSYDDRNSAISFGSSRILAGLGLWELIAPDAAPIRHIHVSDRGRLGRAELHAADHGAPALGYVVPNRVLGAALYARLGQLPRVTLRCPAKVVALEVDRAPARCVVEDPQGREQLEASLVVVADGAGSPLRAALGVEVERWEYDESAVVANVTSERAVDGWAFERFTDEGPVALLPRATGDLAAIVTVPTVAAAALADGPPERYAAVLAARFGDRLGGFPRVGTRAHYPLALVRATRQVVARAVIMGNAAHALHPVAAQGFNLSLRDVAALAEVVADGIDARREPGEAEGLARYAAWRESDQRGMSVISDGLARIFANPLATVGAARSLGLLTFDLLPPAKRAFARRMMGMTGRLPRLARGLPLRRGAPASASEG
jgi:2-octaprenyl-6-methoxyphenol hydroxylase